MLVISNLTKFVEKYPNSILDMTYPRVNWPPHYIGLRHCHADNYAVQALEEGRLHGIVDYSDGKKLMANDLGFKDEESLILWAIKNSKIWGNDYRCNLFINKLAFKSKNRFRAESNFDIIEHWKEVALRNY